jgi:hypothetical protein
MPRRRRQNALLNPALSAILFASSGIFGAALLELQGASAREVAPQIPEPLKPLESKEAIHFSFVDDPLKATMKRVPELRGVETSDDQEILPHILDNTGWRIQQFLEDIVDVTAKEVVVQEKLHRYATVEDSRKQRFDYLILARPRGDPRQLKEYRTDLEGRHVGQSGFEFGYTITWGFTTAGLYLAPQNQDGSRFRYLGTGRIHSTEAYVVAFAQQPDQARISDKVSIGAWEKTLFVQGIVWIAKSNFQILRIRTDLLKPDADLIRQTTDVRFAEVHVEGLTKALWLPQDVTVESTLGRERFRNRHHYSNYRRFRVSAVINPATQ